MLPSAEAEDRGAAHGAEQGMGPGRPRRHVGYRLPTCRNRILLCDPRDALTVQNV